MNKKNLHKLQQAVTNEAGIIGAWFLLLVLVVAACLSACTPTAAPDPQPVSTLPYTPPATQIAAEVTPTVAAGTAVSPTNTPPPTETGVGTAVPATATSAPTTAAPAQPVVIEFDPGEISTTLHRTLTVGQSNCVIRNPNLGGFYLNLPRLHVANHGI
ncbi:MAG: hypothetical protein CL608_02130 [Anaerolineaceae bacterium]|nr:hypothetical protein [Anaerolineaceae bacterium]